MPHSVWLTPKTHCVLAQHPEHDQLHVGQKPPPPGAGKHTVCVGPHAWQASPLLPHAMRPCPVLAQVFASMQQPAQVDGPQSGCGCTHVPLQVSPAAHATQASPPVPHALALPGETHVLSGRQHP
jgi:hypothetical protein